LLVSSQFKYKRNANVLAEVIGMGKKLGTDTEIAEKITKFLEANKGQAFPVDRIARELGISWRRVARLLEVAAVLKGIKRYPFGRSQAYIFEEKGET